MHIRTDTHTDEHVYIQNILRTELCLSDHNSVLLTLESIINRGNNYDLKIAVALVL